MWNSSAMALADLLEKNRRWAAAQLASDPDYFARHVEGQHPRVLVIGCSDSRVPIETVLGVGPGELFIHRNVANIVAYNDVNLAAVVEYAIEHLAIQDVVVCGHYGCGGIKAACRARLPDSYIGDWLMIASWAKRTVDAAPGGPPADPEAYHRAVVEENVRLQLRHLESLSVVRICRERRPGIPRLHGWAYDIATGLVNVVATSDTI